MGSSFIPQGYQPHLSLYQTQRAISLIKRVFQDSLAHALHLERVSAPLFVEPGSGLNDNLNGVERPVSFDIPFARADAEVVHSLAKWKRMALYRYEIEPGMGIYTDMNAIRRDEALDNLHSIYVDQWDWEKVITEESRTCYTLHECVRNIVGSICDTQLTVRGMYPQLCGTPLLERNVTFITAQELEYLYPDKTPKERENIYTDVRCETLKKFLPVYDSLSRALAQTPEDDACRKGLEMIMTQYEKSLEQLGVVMIEAVGQPFDANLHNAVMHIEDENYGENVIVEEFEKGFKIGDKILRYSMVKVAN